MQGSRAKNGKNGTKKPRKTRDPRSGYKDVSLHHGDGCTVCNSDYRAEIELMLLRGKCYTTIANMFPPLTFSAIRRHHIGTGMRALMVKECEKFWSDIIRQAYKKVRKANLDQALKASEYIARKAGAFKDKYEHKHSGKITIDDITRARREADRQTGKATGSK